MESEQKAKSGYFWLFPVLKVLTGIITVLWCGYEYYIFWQYDKAIEKANGYIAKKDYGSALKECDIALGYDDDDPAAILTKAQVLSNMNRYPDALQLVQPLTTQSKVTAHTLYDAAVYAYYSDSTQTAHSFILRSLQIENSDAASWYLAGDIFSQLTNYDSAIVSYRNALRYKIGKPSNVYVALANSFDTKHQSDSAMIYYQKAITANPKNANAYFQKGIALKNADKIQDAIESFRIARTLGSDDAAEKLRQMNEN